MSNIEDQILSALARKSYRPLKPKALARKLGVTAPDYADFRRALRGLLHDGRVEVGKNHTVRPAPPHGTVTGVFKRLGSGAGFVRPHPLDGHPVGAEIHIREGDTLDSATGDAVLVKL